MNYFTITTNDYVSNFKKNCKCKDVPDSKILTLFANIEMFNKGDNLIKLIKITEKYRPNVFEIIKNG